MHVGLNVFGLVHDLYFPHVGLENHAAGKHLRHLVGVYIDGKFHWLDDGSWHIKPDYYGDVLVSRIIATNDDLQVRLEFDDCVDSEFTAFLRNIHVINLASEEREIRLFMHQVFVISDSNASDTVQYIPEERSVLHYKGHRAFLVKGVHADGAQFDSYSVGRFGTDGHEGTFKDAEDGELMGNNVEHGRVDSVIGFHLQVRAHSSKRVYYWIAAGRSEREARKISASIEKDGMLHHILKTANWWAKWAEPTKKLANKLPERYRTSFVRSALIIKSQIDKHGAVIASTDTTMLNYERDAYGYCWPRDAAYVLWPLMRIGYTEELLKFFAFARRSLNEDGYLGHKFQADGALGSSWHPRVSGGGLVTPPIQTDETALVLFLFGQYYRLHTEPELLASFYTMLVKPMANFLAGYVDEDGLPLPSYDLWEEKHLSTTYTASVTYAALIEAAFLAQQIQDDESSIRWREAADTMLARRDTYWDEKLQYFVKGFVKNENAESFDRTIDSSSLFGIFMFGYYDINDPKVSAAYETLKRTLMTDGAKVIRYENDMYRRGDGEPSLDWVQGAMFPSGVIAEQYDSSDEPLSVAPLTWSQAEYMNVLLDMITAPGETS
jgi:GH15 family glucan-1,4-alpha-glucosidase